MTCLRLALTCVIALCLLGGYASADTPDPDRGLYAAWFAPDAIEHAGSLHAYVRNATEEALTVTDVLLDGSTVGEIWAADESFVQPQVREEYIAVANEEVAWYRVYPNPVPPGQVAEVIMRLTPEACEPASRRLTVELSRGGPLTAEIGMAEGDFALEYVGMSARLDELFVYCSTAGAEPEAVEVDGRAVPVTVRPAVAGMRFAHVRLPRAWSHGSYHAVAVRAGQARRAVLLRALPTPPPLGVMGNLNEEAARQYASHLFDVHIAFVPARDEFFGRLLEHGLRGAYIQYRKTRPEQEKYEPVYYDNPERIRELAQEPAIWAHFLEDEPDGRYHRTELSHLSVCRDVERANQVCRILDPHHPVYLQMNHGGFPRNMYIWGQIPDYLCTHAYPFGRDIVRRTREHVEHTAAGSRPRPFIYLCEGYSENAQRQFEPDEMRLEVLTALACGAKSLQWYPAHGSRGLLEHARMWDAVGRMNVVVRQVLPLLSIGAPVGRPMVDGGEMLARSILCGDRALALVLVNRDFSSSADSFRLASAPEVTVRARVPGFMQVRGAVMATFDGPVSVPVQVRPGTVTVTVDEVGAGAVVVLYADGSVPGEMRRIAERSRARFEPMAG